MNLKNIDTLLAEVLAGNKIAVANALNLLENSRPAKSSRIRQLVEQLSRKARPNRHLIGITGPPGVGKSTLISRLANFYRRQAKSVGIISVDPSSRRSGGALLGDRARITHDPGDSGLFIRSMAAGNHLGGLAWRTRHCLTVFEAAYDIIIVETVGVGQSETEIAHVVDSVVFVVQPGSGDALQFMKAGIMEIPDILVINKADQKKLAAKAKIDLETVAVYSGFNESGWKSEIIMVSALEGWGHDQLTQSLFDHFSFLKDTCLTKKRRFNRVQWILMMFKERFGMFGIETLGGESSVLKQIADFDLTNPFFCFEKLTHKMWSLIKNV